MIRKISFVEELLSPVGLAAQPQTMDRLGKLVVLAGPNGAGKTRYLAVLQQQLSEVQQTLAQEVAHEAMLPEEQREIPASVAKTVPKRTTGARDAGQARALLDVLRNSHGYRARCQTGMSNPGAERIVPLTYALAKGGIQRTDAIPPSAADQLTHANITPGFSTAHMSMHAYFTHVARALWSAGDPRMQAEPTVVLAKADADVFNTLLDVLVGGRIDPAHDRNRHLFPLFRGRAFHPVQLSDGESVLVTWAIILHRQKTLADSIILIDEPENHLHPDACIKALRALRDQILGPHGQIWLATHSVQLIAFAGMDAVWLVDEGRVEYAGNKVDKVIQRLLGGEEGRDQLRMFLADADDLGFYKFAAECLVEPAVAGTKDGDPQEAQFAKLLQGFQQGEPLRVLDYGAGKGRLAAALRDAFVRGGEARTPTLSYHAYNGSQSPPDEVEACRERVIELGKIAGVSTEYVDDLRRLSLPEPRMNLVVLSNVLHEIPVDRWLSTFDEIARVLSPEGSLLLMEDQRMSVGELPTAHGFVVLDEVEVAALFGTCPGDGVRALPTALDGRLTQIAVAARVLRNARSESVSRALGLVQERARKEIESLRDRRDRSFQAGRRHAYYSMLHMNAMLAQRTFG